MSNPQIQANREQAVFEAGRIANNAAHRAYNAVVILGQETDSRGYMQLALEKIQEAQFCIGRAERALREEK